MGDRAHTSIYPAKKRIAVKKVHWFAEWIAGSACSFLLGNPVVSEAIRNRPGVPSPFSGVTFVLKCLPIN